MTQLAHSNEHGGLMNKSIGSSYPWSVVGYVHDGATKWRAENLVTGETDWDFVSSCALAHDIAQAYHDQDVGELQEDQVALLLAPEG